MSSEKDTPSAEDCKVPNGYPGGCVYWAFCGGIFITFMFFFCSGMILQEYKNFLRDMKEIEKINSEP